MPVVRVNMRRNLPRSAAKGSTYRIELILSSEFFDIIPGLIAKSKIFLRFFDKNMKDNLDNQDLENVPLFEGRKDSQLSAVWIKNDVAAYDITIPDGMEEGIYRLRLRCEFENSDEEDRWLHKFIILPWISDEFAIFHGGGTQGTEKMLSCCREFQLFSSTLPNMNTSKFLIQEDYGTSIGSHVYDCAVVLTRYLSRVDLMNANGIGIEQRNGIVVELGSGCGLVGLYLGGIFKSVILTDMSSQMTLLDKNVIRNKGHHPECKYQTMSIDWTSVIDRQKLLSFLLAPSEGRSASRVDLIVAADVLYDGTAVTSLVTLLLELLAVNGPDTIAAPPPLILIAQKMRERTLDFAAALPSQLASSVVYEEHSVKIWLISLKNS